MNKDEIKIVLKTARAMSNVLEDVVEAAKRDAESRIAAAIAVYDWLKDYDFTVDVDVKMKKPDYNN